MRRLEAPGVYEGIPAADYHADPCPEPSLSSSLVRAISSKSPWHAMQMHPRFGGHGPADSTTFDLGTAAHAYILEGEERWVEVDANDWRTKAAQQQRDEARDEGLIPILSRHANNVRDMAREVKRGLALFEDPKPLGGDGTPETTVVWKEQTPHGEVWCRARPDWLHHDGLTVDDLKTTGTSAEPRAFIRHLFNSDYHLQAAFYLRGIKAVAEGDGEPTFRFVVVENEAPYAISVIALDPMALDIAHDVVQQAINAWALGLKTKVWPAYPKRVCYAEAPAWLVAREAEDLERGDE